MTDRRSRVPARTAAAAHAADDTVDPDAGRLPPPLPFDVTFHVPAELASVPLVRHLVRTALMGAGVDEEEVDDVTLATDEACTNVVMHGTRLQGDVISYDVALHISPERCVVTVAEREVGTLARVPSATTVPAERHDMADTDSEHGRGIALMALLMDGVQLETDPSGSFRLLLEKDFAHPKPTPPRSQPDRAPAPDAVEDSP